MKIWFDSNNDSFYLEEWFPSQPGGTIEVSEELHSEMMKAQSNGMVISHDVNGYPVAVEAPKKELSREEEIALAESYKSQLLAEAQATISLWQTELQLGVISDEDKASLITWVNYIKAVQAVDTSKAPDITWPKKPE